MAVVAEEMREEDLWVVHKAEVKMPVATRYATFLLGIMLV